MMEFVAYFYSTIAVKGLNLGESMFCGEDIHIGCPKVSHNQ